MSIRVAINGFGRTGRAAFRAARERDLDIEWAGINDLMDQQTLIHLLAHDSVYGVGWRHDAGKVLHLGNGAFCYSFVPQVPPAGYPDRRPRGLARQCETRLLSGWWAGRWLRHRGRRLDLDPRR